MSIKRAVTAAVSLHMLAWLAMLLVFAGLMFLAFGSYWLIAVPLGAGAAALIVGGGLLTLMALGLLCALIASRMRADKPRSRDTERATDREIEERLKPIIGERATSWTKNNTGLAIVGALAAGVIMASSPALRQGFYDATKPIIARKLLRILDRLADE